MKFYCNNCEKVFTDSTSGLNEYGEEICPNCGELDYDELPEPEYDDGCNLDGSIKRPVRDFFEMADRIYEERRGK